MHYSPPLQPARLVKRYKRFLADVITPQGEMLTLHCANTGAMTGCATPGDTVWYSWTDDPRRKYPGSWELTETADGHWICVNTLRANTLVREALQQQRIAELAGYAHCQAEVKYGARSRIDFLLTDPARRPCYVEVKSVTLLQHGRGFFPDTVSLRGQKHLCELQECVRQGARAVLLFAVLHSGIPAVAPAAHLDADYARLLAHAVEHGVEVLCYGAQVSPDALHLTHALPFTLK